MLDEICDFSGVCPKTRAGGKMPKTALTLEEFKTELGLIISSKTTQEGLLKTMKDATCYLTVNILADYNP